MFSGTFGGDSAYTRSGCISKLSEIKYPLLTGQVPAYGDPEDSALLQLFKKLVNFGMTAEIEDQILRMKVSEML